MTRGAHTDQMFELVRLHVAVETSVGDPVVDMETLPHLLLRNAALLTTTLIAVTGLPGLDLPVPSSTTACVAMVQVNGEGFLRPSPRLATGCIAIMQSDTCIL